MKNIVNVSIAGIAFKLEEEAYVKLDAYLQQIRDSYGGSPDGAEILSDLEARIAEIILTRQNASVVVPLLLVESTLEQLGAPEDISEGAPGNNGGETKAPFTASPSGGQIPHRLYRNPDGAKLGGVCNGLGTYFNVDSALVRLLFAIPLVLTVFFFIVGWDRAGNTMTGFMVTAFLLYFLLWIVIPKAKTPLQKIEMRGEKITKDKLEQTFREEFETRGNDPQNIETRARNARNASVFSELFSIIGKVLLFFVKVVVAIIGIAFTVAIIGILAALIAVIIHGTGVIDGITGTYPELLAVIVCLAVLIPLSLAVYGILKLLFDFNHNKPLVTTLVVVWVLTLVFGTVIFIKDMDNIVIGNRVNGWTWDRWKERTLERWQDNLADMEGVREMDEVHTIGSNGRMTHWSPLSIPGDTVWIAPMDSVRLPDNFTLKIKKEGHSYTTPVLAVRKFVAVGKRNFEREDRRYFDRITVQQEVRGDTLFLRADIPEIAGATRQWADADIYVPAQKAVVVLGGMNYNEYFNRY